MMKNTTTGGKQKQDVWKGPLDEKRTVTDLPYIIAFGLYVVFWIAIAIYAFVDGEIEESFMIRYFKSLVFHHDHEVSDEEEAKFIKARLWILGHFILCITVLFVTSVLLRFATKVLVWITLILTTISILVIYGMVGFCFFEGGISYITFIPMVFIIFIYAMIIHAFFKIGIDMVCQVIKDSFKALFFFPSTLVFMVLQFILHLLVVAFSIAVYQYLRSIDIIRYNQDIEETLKEENSTENSAEEYYNFINDNNLITPYHIRIFHIVNIYGCLWACSFIMGTGRMILTATFGTWYHVKDKNLVPRTTLLNCTVMIIRYHLGTIAFASSFLTIIPMFYIIFNYGRDKLKLIYKQPSAILSWLTIISKFSFNALAMCSIHGNKFYESAKDSYILMMKHPLSYLTINTVTESIIFFVSFFVTIIPIIVTLAYLLHHGLFIYLGVGIMSSINSFVLSLTYFMMFRAASDTIRFCYLEDSKFNQENEMKLYEMHVDSINEV